VCGTLFVQSGVFSSIRHPKPPAGPNGHEVPDLQDLLHERLALRVRIQKVPDKQELDGVRLDNMVPGTVREVSPSIGAWLIAEGFAEIEMRRPPDEDLDFSNEPATSREKRQRHPSDEADRLEAAEHRRRKTDN
jgi:hypothetical protein